MKLNPDCIRDVLLYLEENLIIENRTFIPINLKSLQEVILNYSEEDIFYSIYNLKQAKFIEGKFSDVKDNKMAICEIENITYLGHQFLETVRPEPIWNKTKSVVSKVGVHALGFIEGVAHDIAIESAKQAVTIAMTQK